MTQQSAVGGFWSGCLVGALASAGVAYLYVRRALRAEGKGRPYSPLNLSSLRTSSAEGYVSGMTTPSMTPRTGSSSDLAAEGAASQNVKMAVIVRQDVPMSAARIVQHAAWTVLGMFKKLYRRRDAGLKIWDVTGEKLEVLLAPSEDELMAVQAKARALGLPTHTFAGRDRSRKQRSVMAVGPADAEVLRQVTGHLKEL